MNQKRTFIFLFLLALSLSAIAQIPDSIQGKLKILPTDSSKIQYLFDISQESQRSNPELNIIVLDEAEKIAQKSGMEALTMDVKIKKGIHFLYSGDYNTSRALYNEVLEYAKQQNDSNRIATALSELGVSYYYEADDKNALKYFIESYQLQKRLGDTAKIAAMTNNIGVLYNYLGEYENAIKFLKEAIYFKGLVGDSVRLGSSYHNLGTNMDELGKSDSALYYFKVAMKFREKYNDIRGLAKTFVSLSDLQQESGNYDSALFYIDKALSIDLKFSDSIAYAADLYSKADILNSKRELAQAKEISEEALRIQKDARLEASVLLLLAEIESNLNNYKNSSNYRKAYINLQDSLYKVEKEASLQEIRVEFETELKDAEIEELENERKIQVLQSKQDRQFLLIVLLIALSLIAVVVLIYIRYKSKIKSNQVLDEKNRQLSELNQTKDRLFSIISHDLKSPLSSFHTITKSLTDNWGQLEKEELKGYIESLRDSSKEVHTMMDNLLRWALSQTGQLNFKPQELKVQDIVQQVEGEFSSALKASSLSFQNEMNATASITADQDFLKIILRNLISNAIKFSKMNTSIHVRLEATQTGKIISIHDEGIGMTSEHLTKLFNEKASVHEIDNSSKKGTGIGLTLCKELMQKMGGDIRVESEFKKGSTFKLIFPNAA